MKIPFNKPYMTGNELTYVSQAYANGHLAGDGIFTEKCSSWLEQTTGCAKALLTHSCTAALEIAASLCELKPGDEVIMPSYTFVSTANAFVLQGATPVFVDIREDTLNIDETRIEAAISNRTRAIVPVHYAGVGCNMNVIMDIADRHNLVVIEDAAQGIMASYEQQPLGSMGHLSTISFHETKNIISGEGGALLINDSRFIERAERLRCKGTNRPSFNRGEVDKYTWVEKGSSYLPSEVVAAFLWAQMEEAQEITRRRLVLWNNYHRQFEELERKGKLRRPRVPANCHHNAHMYAILLPSGEERNKFIRSLKSQCIDAVFHYVPLHSSPMGRKYGKVVGSIQHTEELCERLVRLPLWLELESRQNEVIDAVHCSLL